MKRHLIVKIGHRNLYPDMDRVMWEWTADLNRQPNVCVNHSFACRSSSEYTFHSRILAINWRVILWWVSNESNLCFSVVKLYDVHTLTTFLASSVLLSSSFSCSKFVCSRTNCVCLHTKKEYLLWCLMVFKYLKELAPRHLCKPAYLLKVHPPQRNWKWCEMIIPLYISRVE